MKRRDFLKNAGIILAGTAVAKLPAVSMAAPAVQVKKEVSVGIFAPSHCSAPVIYASVKDFFKNAGIKVNLVNYPQQPELLTDVVSGKLYAGQSIAPLVMTTHLGASAVPKSSLVVPMIMGVHGSNLMISTTSNISKPQDFKGKRVASPSKVSIHYLLTRLFLEKNGMDLEKDTLFSVVKLKELPLFLKEGKIDAFMYPEPTTAMAEDTGKAFTYVLNKFIWKYHPCCCLAMKRDVFEKDREMSKAFVSSVARASLTINREDNRKELATLLRTTPYGFAEIPSPVLEIAFANDRSDFQPFPYQSSAVFILNLLKKYKLIPEINSKQVAHEVFLSDFMRECFSDMGVKPPKSNFRYETVMGEVLNLET